MFTVAVLTESVVMPLRITPVSTGMVITPAFAGCGGIAAAAPPEYVAIVLAAWPKLEGIRNANGVAPEPISRIGERVATCALVLNMAENACSRSRAFAGTIKFQSAPAAGFDSWNGCTQPGPSVGASTRPLGCAGAMA